MRRFHVLILSFTHYVFAFCAAMGAISVALADDAQFDAAYAGNLAFEAQQSGQWLPDFYRLNPQLNEEQLYAVQAALVRSRLAAGDQIAGYKGGFIPAAPVGGVLGASGMLADGSKIRARDFRLLIVEAEIAFRFCAAVSQPLADIAALQEVVCEIMPAMEIADGALRDFATVRKDFTHLRSALIALNVAAKHVLLGAPAPASTIDFSTLEVATRANGEIIGRRDLDKPSNLWANVLWVVNEFVLKRGYTIDAGHIIIPGNLTGIHAAAPGRYEIDYGPLGRLSLAVDP